MKQYKNKKTGKIVEITRTCNLDGLSNILVSEEIELSNGETIVVFGYTMHPETFNEQYEQVNDKD